MTDDQREKAIDLYLQLVHLENDPARKRAAMLRMAELICARSPEVIARMEMARGLRLT